MTVIGIDVGTTAAKVVAFSTGGTRTVATRPYPLLEPQPGHQVQDAAAVLAAVDDALAECLRGLGAGGAVRTAGLSVSTAMHGLVGLDASGEPTTPLLTWADGRAVAVAAELRASGVAARLHDLTGTPVHPMSPLAKLLWFARHDREVLRRTRRWVDLKALVLAHLTGSTVTDRSSASGTGLLDRRTGRWSAEALAVAGVPAGVLPTVVEPGTVLALRADVARRVGLPVGTAVVAGAADGPLGNLGVGALRPGVLGLSLGTSGAVRTVTSTPPERLDPGLFCYALRGPLWVLGGAVSTGGVVLRWAADALAPGAPSGTRQPEEAPLAEALLAEAATVPPGSDGLVMLPHLLPERAPSWDPTLPGAYLGLRPGHGRGHLVRAAVEGVVNQLAGLVDRLEALHPVHEVRATGGALRSAVWRESLAAALGRPVRVVDAVAGSALGAAALGAE
ncbi:gluconokinase, partial [Actinotalea ferrariae]|uniref:gluconokinase n=1 Tax=Actinotalea ferrariae TaxID=1386098 RepID=UPI001C8B6631